MMKMGLEKRLKNSLRRINENGNPYYMAKEFHRFDDESTMRIEIR